MVSRDDVITDSHSTEKNYGEQGDKGDDEHEELLVGLVVLDTEHCPRPYTKRKHLHNNVNSSLRM